MLLKNKQTTEEINKEMKICLETNDNENTRQNLQDVVEAMLRINFSNTNLPQETIK